VRHVHGLRVPDECSAIITAHSKVSEQKRDERRKLLQGSEMRSIRVSVRVSDSVYLTRTSQTVAATPSATDLASLLQVGSLLVNSPTYCDSALSVEGPRRQGAVRIGQLDEAERRADRDQSTDRRYTADFFENPLVLVPQDRKRLITGASLRPAGIGGREDGSMGLFCLLGS